MAAAPETTIVDIPGTVLGKFKKTQYLGHTEGMLTKEKPKDRMKEIHEIANKAMHHVHKEHKHRHLGFAKCYVTTHGVYLYEAEEKVNVKAKQSWAKPAKDIYCVVLGKRQHLFHNNLACIMQFADPTSKPVLPVKMDCVVIEFHHDHKGRAAQFHKACEEMMKALLYDEMAKLDINKDGDAPSVTADADAGDDDAAPVGYMDVPEPIQTVGKKARASIDASLEADNDYLCVVAGTGFVVDGMDDDDVQDKSLSDVLTQLDGDDDDEL